MDISEMIGDMFPRVVRLNRSIFSKVLSEHIHGENFALNVLILSGGISTPGEISAASNISTARVASILNSMEKKGYITRATDTKDRRKVIVEITETGRAYAGEALEKLKTMLGVIFDELGEDDVRELIRILKKTFDVAENAVLNNRCHDCKNADVPGGAGGALRQNDPDKEEEN